MSKIYSLLLQHVSNIATLIAEDFDNELQVNQFLRKFGWYVDISHSEADLIYEQLNIATDVSNIKEKVVEVLYNQDFNEVSINDIVNTIESIYSTFDNINNISIYPFNEASFQQQLKDDYINYVLCTYIDTNYPKFYAILRFLNVIELVEINNEGITNRLNFFRYKINLSKLFNFIVNPIVFLKDEYNWNENDIDAIHICSKLYEVLNYFGLRPVERYPPRELAEYFYTTNQDFQNIKTQYLHLFDIKRDLYAGGLLKLGMNFTPIPDIPLSGGNPTGFAISPVVEGLFSGSYMLTPSSTLSIKGNLSVEDAIWFLLYINKAELVINDSNIGISGELLWEFQPLTPLMLLGQPGETRIEIPEFFFSTAIKGLINEPEFELGLGTSVDGYKPISIIFTTSSADGFISQTLGNNPVNIDVQGTLFWSSLYGLKINGNVGFTLLIPVNKTLGPLLIESLTVNPVIANDNLSLNLGSTFNLSLGPINLRIENIGAKMILKNLEGTETKGIFGNIDIDWEFKSPTGVGLSIDAPPVKGGGFLNYDESTSTYTGGLELHFSKISFSAIGIISTKLPGGEPGYSLLVIVSVEFTPLQIGMGFTINGIGGLLGLHRTSNPDVLRSGIRYNTLDHILFPKNIVENANTIISNLGQAFPIRKDQFMLGPMAKIGWGTPTLLTIDIGIVIEMPDPVRLLILGILRAQLPSEQNAILRLQVNFLGIIDFKENYLSFDATLYDSKILTFGLFGDMALRLNWGNRPNFLLSVGGFHPSYTPPPLNLPSMQRLTIVLADEKNLKISVESYFAVTSNSAQFGARVYAMARAGKFSAVGELWFNVLFQFSPFYFAADMGVQFAIKMGSKTLIGIYVALLLEGPDPWRAQGQAAFKILFVKVKVRFDATFGRQRAEAIEAVKVDELIKEALMLQDNWETLLPDQNNQMVAWRKEEESEVQSVDPSGAIKISQRVMPLNTLMEKFGSAAISDFNLYRINSATIETMPVQTEKVQDYFARNEFSHMNDEEKLSRDGYELFESGVIVGSNDNQTSHYAVHKEAGYEEITMDSGFRRKEVDKFLIADQRMEIDSILGYATRTGLSRARLRTTSAGPDKIRLSIEGGEFVLANRKNLQQVGGGISFDNSMEAERYLIQQKELSPTTVEDWIIANRYELV